MKSITKDADESASNENSSNDIKTVIPARFFM